MALEIASLLRYQTPGKAEPIIHVYWNTPMGGLQCGMIEFDELLKGWYFAPNLVGLKEFNARQLIVLGTWVNELNKIVHSQTSKQDK